MQKVSVTITANREYYVNDRKVPETDLERELRAALLGNEGVIVLHADKSVPVELVVKVAGIATSLEAKVTLATKPE
jgi:biopolymer transport protein ExbD